MTAPHRDGGLWPAAEDGIQALNAFVRTRGLAGVDAGWEQVEREFADERNYVSLHLGADPGDSGPTVRIEFGVQDESQRHATGGFAGRWSRDRLCFEQIAVMLVDGKPSDVWTFLGRLAPLRNLPETAFEVAEGDAQAV